MQGIDGASAAAKPGEIDHVTRSRSEARLHCESCPETPADQVCCQPLLASVSGILFPTSSGRAEAGEGETGGPRSRHCYLRHVVVPAPRARQHPASTSASYKTCSRCGSALAAGFRWTCRDRELQTSGTRSWPCSTPLKFRCDCCHGRSASTCGHLTPHVSTRV